VVPLDRFDQGERVAVTLIQRVARVRSGASASAASRSSDRKRERDVADRNAQIDELVCRHTEEGREATWMEADALRHAAGRQARCVEARERA
jgi:hypothetical protein